MSTKQELFLGRSGIPTHPTHSIYDSSKVQAFMRCPRGFFYSYVLGWRWKAPNVHLVFGSGWHEAMEYLLHPSLGPRPDGWTPKDVSEAYNAFKALWEEYYPPDPLGIVPDPAKNLGGALRGLAQYASVYGHRDNPTDTLHTEIHGTVPIGNNRVFHVKLDTLRRHPAGSIEEGKLYSLEHKTTGRLSRNNQEKWHYLFQVGAYAYFLWVYEDDGNNVDGVHINLCVFRKDSYDFVRIPVLRNIRQHEEWVSDAHYWIDRIEQEMSILAEEQSSQRVMHSFPRNSASCSQFGCQFPGMCGTHCNPLQHLDRVPIGMEVQYWDPSRGPDLREPKTQAALTDKQVSKEVERLTQQALEG